MTNEEWFCGLNTEQKAKWLDKHSEFCYVMNCEYCYENKSCNRHSRDTEIDENYKRWLEWLKEKHTNGNT